MTYTTENKQQQKSTDCYTLCVFWVSKRKVFPDYKMRFIKFKQCWKIYFKNYYNSTIQIQPLSFNTLAGISVLIFIFVYLAVPGLSCGIFSCSKQTLSCSMWDWVLPPGIKPKPPALGAWNLSCWTTRELFSFER